MENLEDGRSENLRALDALRTKSENFQQSTNKLEETPKFFPVTMYQKHETAFLLFSFFSICLMFDKFL